MAFHGQHGEDEFMNTLFEANYKGVCVDVGAHNGSGGSNTYFFEKKGWRALCIEPILEEYNKCVAIRKECVNCCIGETDEDDKAFHIYNLVGGNTSAISSLEPDQRLVESHKHLILSTTVVQTKIRSLNSLLRELDYPKDIDFISIDTENTELDVLKGIDFAVYNVKYLIVENNFDEPHHEEYLKQFGYKKFKRIAVNDFYVKSA